MLHLCPEIDAPFSPADAARYVSQPPGWSFGVAPETFVPGADANSGVLLAMLLMVVLVGLNFRHVRRLLATLPHDLLSVRRRVNVFDEHTANETRVLVLLLLQLCIAEGILLWVWLSAPAPALTGSLAGSTGMEAEALRRLLPSGLGSDAIGLLCGVTVGLYVFQLGACCLLGYVFTDQVNASLWRRGLNSSQVLLGMLLVIPALLALFQPGLAAAMLWLSAGMYITLRLCYIIKGFRIFFQNFPSLLYFILYLCTLEIIPLIAAVFLSREICLNNIVTT